MVKSINVYEFITEFEAIRPNQFTREGLEALFEYLAEYDEDIELDVVALCCSFAEYHSLEEFQSDYGDDYIYESINQIAEQTAVIQINDDSFIIEQF
jgi:hypothetical protein|tara:strand:+ start:203 stop:493 length:291 start_codon:yes stop_codon:yes gene_type:complete